MKSEVRRMIWLVRECGSEVRNGNTGNTLGLRKFLCKMENGSFLKDGQYFERDGRLHWDLWVNVTEINPV
jgi:hypothetical protein